MTYGAKLYVQVHTQAICCPFRGSFRSLDKYFTEEGDSKRAARLMQFSLSLVIGGVCHRRETCSIMFVTGHSWKDIESIITP
ncbi:hypothetical protein RRG08_028565 [Elysia crispata]|uniref:Uncharacterized protein n=1 Tax=Elysia crispata TaxID=231223 RepID=A0AAE0YA18_9GAST|nr:hypothetical protein RRG08_028565 [Elysia crispata]